MTYKQETVSTVNHLLEVLNERIPGYKKAVENVEDSDAKAIFTENANLAQRFADKLLPFSNNFDSSQFETRPQGDAWRVWMDFKSIITSGNSNATINSSITGEKNAIDNYEEAIAKNNLDQEVKGLISKQLADIKSAKERIEKLKH